MKKYLSCKRQLIIVFAILITACEPESKSTAIVEFETLTKTLVENESIAPVVVGNLIYSNFGRYQALSKWSDWCGVSNDQKACSNRLSNAVNNPTQQSRPSVRKHGWKLWAAINEPIDQSGYDPVTRTSTKFGVNGCYTKSSNGSRACSGVFPLWLTWPNAGIPYQSKHEQGAISFESSAKKSSLLAINRSFSGFSTTNYVAKSDTNLTTTTAAVLRNNPDPTKIQTVNTIDVAPSYQLPPLVVVKQCGIDPAMAEHLIDEAYNGKTKAVRADGWKKLDEACVKQGIPNVVCTGGICDGSAFVNQGDVMIATESLSVEAWNSIQNYKLYGGTDVLQTIYAKNDKEKAANQVASWIDKKFISTKHMYWPVKGCNPQSPIGKKGCRVRYGALPPWVPATFKNISYSTNAQYLGYEKWGKVVAIDTCGKDCMSVNSASLKLEGVKNVSAITTSNPDVYQVESFVHIQVSEETLNKAFTATDRALLDQATIWAYGKDSNGFEAGDYLVVAAMHITTKEIDTWAFQSVWWSPMNDTLGDCPLNKYNNCFGQSNAYVATNQIYSGLDRVEIKKIDQKVGISWRNNYLMTDSYGIPYEIDGTPTNINNYFTGLPPKWATERPTGEKIGQLPVSMNVYIEPVIHPLGGNCQNCHRRAGFPGKGSKKGEYVAGVGRSNYQNAQCPSLLGDYGSPDVDPCMQTPWAWNANSAWSGSAKNNCKQEDGTLCEGNEAFPIVSTDDIWLIADGHVQKQ